MKLKIYYHVCTINHYKEIVSEHLKLLKASGLYDRCDSINIGISGKAVKIDDPKVKIRDVKPLDHYEYPTLKLLWDDAQEESFFALYIHTKGVSYPGNEGGKYWRDYMNYYNITLWKECEKKLRKGYTTVGVKLLTRKDFPAYRLHYSGNFFWTRSSYVKGLADPYSMNVNDRYSAEMWVGLHREPIPASLCQNFVDYNTKGVFRPPCMGKGINYVHTLSWNYPSQTKIATELLNSLCHDFKHYVVDLGFPLESDKLPDGGSVGRNTDALQSICAVHGSSYMKLDNIGVSQNWTNVYRKLKLKDDDILVGADPDERPLSPGWVEAMGNVMRDGRYNVGMCSLMMTDHESIIKKDQVKEVTIGGVRCWIPQVSLNWALIGFKGSFLKKIKEIPYPADAPRYGYIESMTKPLFEKHGYIYVIMPDYKVKHTDYELGEPGTSKLLREWKNTIIFKRHLYGQLSLSEFLQMKKEGKL